MKMMKIISTSLIALSMSSVALMVHAVPNEAHDVYLHNKTNQDSTVKIAGGCSSDLLGEKDGVTRAGQDHKIGKDIVFFICASTPDNCQADLYMDDHCGNNHHIGNVVLDINHGIKNYSLTDPRYHLEINGFDLKMTGGY